MSAMALGSGLVRWLVGVRWAIIVVLGLSLPACSMWLALPVEWAVALPTLAAMALANFVVARKSPALDAGSGGSRFVAVGVVFDMIGIAVILAASGGAANPFSALLFVYVALAASLLPARFGYALAGMAALTFGALFALPKRAACDACAARAAPHDSGLFSSHLVGMWVAFALGALLIVFFLTRVRHAIEARDQELTRLRRAADDAEKFASLGTLAAGAAHELATPLGTIAILSRELERADSVDPVHAGASISAQVDRCRDVLRRMQPGARKASEMGAAVLGRSVEQTVRNWKAAHPEGNIVCGDLADARVALSEKDLEAALSVLLDNALFSTQRAGADAPIRVSATVSSEGARIDVRDEGLGIPASVSDRIGEPFLTTKEPGEGMGLGLYLVRTLLAEVGGRLEVAANTPRGARVSILVGASSA